LRINAILARLPVKDKARMTCFSCGAECRKFGKHCNGLRHYQGPECKRTFTEPHADPPGGVHTTIATAVLLVLFACVPLFVDAAQGPPASKQPAGKKESQISAQQQKSTELPLQPGLSKTELSTGNSGSDAKTLDRNGPKDSDPDWWMIILTAGLVVVGFGQVLVLARQTDIINKGLAETRKATKLTRKSVALLNRPRFVARSVSVKDTAPMFEPEALRPVAGSFYISNAGTGRGRIVSVDCQVFRGQTLPTAWPFAADRSRNANKSPSSDDDAVEWLYSGEAVEWPFETQLAAVDMENLAGTIYQTIGVYVMGKISYRDDTGTFRTAGFCRKWDQSTGRFQPVADPDYEYAE
jgi:hypothetical protein